MSNVFPCRTRIQNALYITVFNTNIFSVKNFMSFYKWITVSKNMRKMSIHKKKQFRMQELNPEPREFQMGHLIRLTVGPLWLEPKTVESVCSSARHPIFKKLSTENEGPLEKKPRHRSNIFCLCMSEKFFSSKSR